MEMINNLRLIGIENLMFALGVITVVTILLITCFEKDFEETE
jgi:hypothetical protein